MRIVHLIFILIVFVSCNQKANEKVKQQETNKAQIVQVESNKLVRGDSFDKSHIPANLLEYIKVNIDSLRVPEDNDYEVEYYEKAKIIEPPFFCTGYFNKDTLIDYAMVLIKDSTKHCVFAFHRTKSSFESFVIESEPFLSEYNASRLYATLELSTEKNRVLEAIDTVYRIKNDGIAVSNLYNSSSHLQVWKENENKYEALYFD